MPLPFHEIADDDISASRYVSQSLIRAIKQLEVPEADKEAAEADSKTKEGTMTAVNQVIRLVKAANISLKNIVENVGTPNYELVQKVATDIASMEEPLRLIAIEFVDAKKVRDMKSYFQKMFKYTNLIETGKIRRVRSPANMNLYDEIIRESDQLKPVVQALLDTQGIKLPKEIIPDTPIEQTEDLEGSGMSAGCCHCSGGMISGFSHKRFL